MKLNVRAIMMVMVSLMFFLSCEKDNSINAIEEENAQTNYFTRYESDPWEALKDPDDLQNQRVNWVLFHFSYAIKEACKNPDFRKTIIDEIWDAELRGTSITEIVKKEKDLEVFIESQLRASIGKYLNDQSPVSVAPSKLNDSNWSAINTLWENLYYDEFSYDPWVYFVVDKKDISKSYKEPIVAIAEQVNDEDDVIAFEKDKIVLVSEEDAMTFQEPMIFVGNVYIDYSDAEDNTDYTITGNETPDGELSLRSPFTYLIDMKKLQIKNGHRYEGSGKSEIAGGIGNYYQTTRREVWPTGVAFDFIGGMRWNKIQITKDDISSSRIFTGSWNCENLRGEMSDYSSQQLGNPNKIVPGLVMITYEHDWYSTKYWQPSCNIWGQLPLTEFKAKYSNEYYWRNCHDNAIGVYHYPGDIWFFRSGSKLEVNNSKCSFTFERFSQ